MERTALERMGMFGSTSPSFLILLSMDRLLPRLESELPDRLNALAREVAGLRLKAQAQGLWGTAGLCDPCRLCLCHAALEMGKEDFYAGLRQAGIEPEYLSESHCVLLPDIRGEALTAVSDWLKSLPTGAPIKNMPPPPRAEAVMTPRQAAFAPSRQIDVDEAEGRVAARAESPCPPGLPLVMPGERIDLNVKKILKTAGTERVSVVE
jgi:hypothetical protein